MHFLPTTDFSNGIQGHLFQNWSQTYSSSPELYFEPSNVEQLQSILKKAHENQKKVKVIGSGLSPSNIACTDDYMISMKELHHVLNIDVTKCVISVEAGVIIEELVKVVLPENGLAFSNLPSVSGQTVGGIIGTGTHGTGSGFGSFAECILEITLMTADGSIVRCSKDENLEIFRAACCHLGVLGVVLSVKLQCEPAFALHQKQQAVLLSDLLKNVDDHVAKSQHFKFCWFPHSDFAVRYCLNHTEKPAFEKRSWFWNVLVGYYLLELFLWFSTFLPCLVPVINRTFYKLCYLGSSECVKRSDKLFNIECLFKQYVTEWAIPREHTRTVLEQMKTWLDENQAVKAHFPVEVRFVKRDNIMLSPSGDCDVTYIGIISYRPYGKDVPHEDWWNFFENLAMKYGGKPHWAKAHKVTAKDFRKMYNEFDHFMLIRRQLDPHDLFLNDYWQRILCD